MKLKNWRSNKGKVGICGVHLDNLYSDMIAKAMWIRLEKFLFGVTVCQLSCSPNRFVLTCLSLYHNGFNG